MAIQKKRGQQIWLDVHLYIGLTVGFIFALMGLTGRILIFLAGLIRWMDKRKAGKPRKNRT